MFSLPRIRSKLQPHRYRQRERIISIHGSPNPSQMWINKIMFDLLYFCHGICVFLAGFELPGSSASHSVSKWQELQKYATLPGKYVHLKIIYLYLLGNSDICRFPLVRKPLRTIKECIYACGTIQTLKQ